MHNWEEPCISGTKGSGTIFFAGCNLRCVFCQNHKISQEEFKGNEITNDELADIFIQQQEKGVHNINLVSPTSYLYNIKEAIILAKKRGLNIPIVYNTNSFENIEAIKELEGLIDIYLPDLKYYSDDLAKKYSKCKNYFKKATEAILQMYYQVGKPIFSEDGIIQKGLVIRHLVLPNATEDSMKILDWIKDNIPKSVCISIMSQYYPTHKASSFEEINRKITCEEYNKVIEYAKSIGLQNIYYQELSSADKKYTPNFK